LPFLALFTHVHLPINQPTITYCGCDYTSLFIIYRSQKASDSFHPILKAAFYISFVHSDFYWDHHRRVLLVVQVGCAVFTNELALLDKSSQY